MEISRKALYIAARVGATLGPFTGGMGGAVLLHHPAKDQYAIIGGVAAVVGGVATWGMSQLLEYSVGSENVVSLLLRKVNIERKSSLLRSEH